MDPILKSYFNNFKKSFEVPIATPVPARGEGNDGDAFERFVNYVLFSLDYPDMFIGDSELLDFVCVGGSNDTGIDGLGILVNDRLVRSIDEVKEMVQASRKVNVEFVFVQSKMGSKFDAEKLGTFGTGVEIFFSDQHLPENSRIKELREIKDFIYSDEKVISKFEKNPKLFLYYVSTAAEPPSEYFNKRSEWLWKRLTEDFYFESVEISPISGKQLIKFCRELENKFEVQINVTDIFPLIVDSKEDIQKAYAFTCKASEFLKILKKEDGSLRRALFSDNVRDYLGSTGAVNTEIEKTILEAPEMFLLCNNGITVVCTNFEQVRDKLVKIENPQIVNGCQTSNSIFNLRNNANIGKVQLLVRLISTEHLGITNRIVRGTNKQNQVLDEAFEATLPFHQETLEPFFVAYDNDIKIYYERRARQYSNDPLINKTQIVNLRILTQTFVSMFLNAPHDSHRHEAKLLKEYAGEKGKRKIFRDDHGAYSYYICALTWYMFEKYFREGRIDRRYLAYKAHLYLIFRMSVGVFPPKLTKSKGLDTYCDKLLKLLRQDQFKSHVGKVLDVFDQTQSLWTKTRSPFGMKDNKEFTELLLQNARKRFIQGPTPPVVDDAEITFEGTVLRIVWKNGHWFGFIAHGLQYDNLYFDRYGFVGEVRELVPHVKVKFGIGTNDKGKIATNVELIK